MKIFLVSSCWANLVLTVAETTAQTKVCGALTHL